MDELMRPAEVARMLGVSRTWLYDAAKDGRSRCACPTSRLDGDRGARRATSAPRVATGCAWSCGHRRAGPTAPWAPAGPPAPSVAGPTWSSAFGSVRAA
jgi:hypothetical protein